MLTKLTALLTVLLDNTRTRQRNSAKLVMELVPHVLVAEMILVNPALEGIT